MSRRSLVLLAAACVLVVPQLPLLGVLAWPLQLLTTALHESGHALAVLLTGGEVLRIEIYADGSGVTWSRGGFRLLVASAGYVGSTLLGCLLLVLAQRGQRHKALLVGLMLFFGAFTVLYARNWLSLVVGCVLLVLLVRALTSGAAGTPAMTFALDLVALGSCTYALYDFVGLFLLSMGGSSFAHPTDAQQVADMTGVPAAVWALGWGLFSAGVAWKALEVTLRADRGASAEAAAAAVDAGA